MTTRIDSDADGIRVTGEMTVYTASQVKQPLIDAVCDSPANVQMDLSGVSDLDTAGVQLLLLAHREALASGRQLRLVAESNIVRDVLTLFGALGMLKDARATEGRP
ncbi:MAG TPA: STAS domain-containing protein [Steroidobacteraceae bacterium]|nr:STAS domain-containing protein [Steroidobacteraceae bacterium]